MREDYASGEVARLSGVGYKVVDYWARSGFLVPSTATAAGKGTNRVYSFRDLVALRVAGQLRRQGVSLQSLRKVVAFLRERGYEAPLAEVFLVSDGHDVYTASDDNLLSLLRRPGQITFAWVVDLGSVVEELRAKVAA